MSYLGSKGASGLYQAIIGCMPPHDVYIETHLGTGVVLKNKPLCASSYAFDLDQQVISSFLVENPHINASIQNDSCIPFLDNLLCQTLDKRVLIYADPPYLLSTRTSKHRYKYDYTDQDHIELLEILRQCADKGAYVILSGYPSSLYDTTLPDWHSIELQAMTRGGVRTEKLWMNFDNKNASKHWATFAGANFIKRQQIKRKADRWAKNYEALPNEEKVAVLSALLATHVTGRHSHE